MENVIIGSLITVTVNLTTQNPNLAATGVIVLQDNGSTIATQPLAPLLLMGNNVSGTVFTLQSSVLGLGLHNLIVYYAGDINFPATSFTSSNLDKNIIPA